MKHVKDYQLFETGECPTFSNQESSELEKLGFKYENGNYIYSDKVLTLTVGIDSTDYRGEIDEWFTLHVSYRNSFNTALKTPELYKGVNMSAFESKTESYDTFEDLVKNIKIYQK